MTLLLVNASLKEQNLALKQMLMKETFISKLLGNIFALYPFRSSNSTLHKSLFLKQVEWDSERKPSQPWLGGSEKHRTAMERYFAYL